MRRMDQRTEGAIALIIVMALSLLAFLAFYRGDGFDRSPGWKRARRWWRHKRR